jgi:hypothetical protein
MVRPSNRRTKVKKKRPKKMLVDLKDEELRRDLKRYAQTHDLSMAQVIRKALGEYLKAQAGQ